VLLGQLISWGRALLDARLEDVAGLARKAGWPLRIAARKPLHLKGNPNVQADWEHYHHDIKPLLERGHATFVGEVGGPEKDRFLREAAALLFPIRWPEPFGLVMAEALACGTPVIALRDGSVPEVIEDGASGFICSNEEEMVAAVARVGELDRQHCRAEAERRFSPAAMARAYEHVYERLQSAQPEGMPAATVAPLPAGMRAGSRRRDARLPGHSLRPLEASGRPLA
jgi:glycosyltransferase involved in cell wall biosynthesis